VSIQAMQERSLAWLLHPVSREEFFEEYWEKRPLVIRRKQPDYLNHLISLDEIDRVLTTLDLRYPNVILKNADGNVTSADYTVNGDSLDVAKVYQLFGQGSTIVLAFLDAVVPALTSFARQIESEFTFPCQTNVYLTPAGAKGARYHYDTHDVFVLQVTNSKQWTTYGTPLEHPLKNQDFDSAVHERGEPSLHFELKAGDVAYIPRGVVHDARSGNDVSLHITLGILSYTWIDLLVELAADTALQNSAFRKALPPGFARQDFDRTQAREIFRGLVERLAAQPDFDTILDRFVDEFIAARPPMLRGQMGQLAALGGLTMESVAGARTGAASHVRTDGGSTSVDCYGRKINFPRHVAGAVQFALSHSRFVVRELPGDLDDQGKLAVVRRLIREGLVVVHAT
jgi:ribosomal protein L16 Arg81 hydroxylase